MEKSSHDLPQKAYFRPDEVASIFSVTVRTVYRWHQEGKIDGSKITEKCLRFPRQVVIKFINSLAS
jgi:excisionase family DNA binding protein